jgi:hypothetical protein
MLRRSRCSISGPHATLTLQWARPRPLGHDKRSWGLETRRGDERIWWPSDCCCLRVWCCRACTDVDGLLIGVGRFENIILSMDCVRRRPRRRYEFPFPESWLSLCSLMSTWCRCWHPNRRQARSSGLEGKLRRWGARPSSIRARAAQRRGGKCVNITQERMRT